MQLVNMLEDSETHIKNIALDNIYVSSRNQNAPVKFRQINMYGTLYTYKGYGLDTNNYDGAYVPRHLLDTYNNQYVTNPRNKISKLDMAKLLEILGMQNLYEGCPIEQIANFRDKYKITYYVMNFRYKLFETSSNPKNNRHHKPLVFLCANNHLYPIEKEEDRQNIFNKFASSIGGGIKKLNITKEEDEDEEEETHLNIITTGRDINDDGIVTYGHLLNNELTNDFTQLQGRAAFTESGSVQLSFYSEIEKGNIHNNKFKTPKGNIVACEMGDLYIEENQNIEGVLHIIDKLNRDSTNYKYMGQSLYTPAYAYFIKRLDRNIVSYCSPQVYNILKDNINSPFLEFYKNSVKVAYDKNKQHTGILTSCGDFGWPLFSPTDEVKRFNPIADIETGLYFIETFDSFLLKGNGWYFDGVVEKALKYEFLIKEDIKYYMKPSHILKQDHF